MAAEKVQEEVKVKVGLEEQKQRKVQEAGGEDGDLGEDRTIDENPDRTLAVLPGAAEEAPVAEDEDEFVFEVENPAVGMRVGWFALARYYSSRTFPAKTLFANLFNVWGEGSVRALRDNRFNFVLRGGPWTFRGDAVIVVFYDGLARCSSIPIETISLWIHIYDIPIAMLTAAFVSALGAKVGRVLEVGEAVKDFQRVRVEFALSDPLKKSVSMKVRGHGLLEFFVKYENVPYFCFGCARIGHGERECPNEDMYEEGGKFGIDLRASPFRRGAGRLLSFQAPPQTARRGLNFSGEQRERVTSATGSSSLNGGWRKRGNVMSENHRRRMLTRKLLWMMVWYGA
jgi:hypothetical protein